MRLARALLVAASGALVTAPPLAAQPLVGAARGDSLRDSQRFSFYARGPYRPQVPRPEALLGFRLGDRNSQYAEQERVLLAVADAAKDRVRVEELGATHEGRRMRIYIVSAPENIARLDAIRADLDRIADPRGAAAGDVDAAVRRTPPVVWISESVHGNESPGFESGMQLLYQLAASDEPATLEALRRTIVVVNPSANPDGHERFAVWYNSVARSDPTPDAYEHREPWSIQGRFNHYRFNLNRDVMTATQPEVQAMLRGVLRWHPQVLVDQHGQTTNYFFPPAARPVNTNIGAASEKWLTYYGRANAAAFDLYYPGYWDSWPSLTGATGMTYETDGGGWKGILWRREDGSLLSFRDGIAKHWTTAMATIEATAARAEERLRDYAAFRRDAVEAGRGGRMRRVVIVPGRDPQRAAELAAGLLRAGIEVRRADRAFGSGRAHAYGAAWGTGAAARRFDAGAYVVDLAQPQGRVARAVLEPDAVLDTVFARTQVDRYRRNQRRGEGGVTEGYEFYDVTAWSLPVAYGVEAYWTEDAEAVGGEPLALPGTARPGPPLLAEALPAVNGGMLTPAPFTAAPVVFEGPAAPAYGDRAVSGEVLPVDVGGGVAGGERARSAYVFSPERSGALRLAFHLLAADVRVSVATLGAEAGGRQWPRGTFVVRVARNDSSVHATVDRLARESGVDVVAVNSAFTERDQFGIGGDEIVPLERPRIAIVGDEGIAQTSFGDLWWGLERRYGLDFAHLGWAAIGRDLSRYNVIVIPSGSPAQIGARVGKDGVDRLKAWVRGGGTLVTMGAASTWAAREDVGLTSARAVGAGDDAKSDAKGDAKPAPARRDSAAARRAAPAREDLLAATSPGADSVAPVELPGSNFDVVLDRTHWLTFGYERPRLTALVEGGTFLKLSREGSNVAVFPTTGPLVRGGFTWPENTERTLRGSAMLIEEPLGSGHVILFTNEPMFRGWWRALDKLALNAMVLAPAF